MIFGKATLLVLAATVNMVRLFTIIILLFKILFMLDATAVLCVIWSNSYNIIIIVNVIVH